MGNSASAAAQWTGENVLFVDFNAPPFSDLFKSGSSSSPAGADERQSGGHDGRVQQQGGAGGRRSSLANAGGLKLAIPPEAKLGQNAVFAVDVTIHGRTSQFQLRCQNDPTMALVLCDPQGGRILKEIPVALLRSIAKRGPTVIACSFVSNASVTGGPRNAWKEHPEVEIVLQFASAAATQQFADICSLAYGVRLYERDRERFGHELSPGESMLLLQSSQCCPIHGTVRCRCRGVKMPFKETQPIVGFGPLEIMILSKRFPLRIVGKAEPGSRLKWSDLTAEGRKTPPVAVEWRISFVPGAVPEFEVASTSSWPDESRTASDNKVSTPGTKSAPSGKSVPSGKSRTPNSPNRGVASENATAAPDSVSDAAFPSGWNVIADNHLQVTESMVGKYVQAKVVRALKGSREELVYSLATQGPVTLNDSMAAAVLKLIVSCPSAHPIEMGAAHLQALFPSNFGPDHQLNRSKGYSEGTLYVTSEGVELDFSDSLEAEPNTTTLDWSAFYATRLSAEQSGLGSAEGFVLRLHTQAEEGVEGLPVALQSGRERDAVYHTIYFLKLHGFEGFDRWPRDIETGNYAVFKQLYAQIWSKAKFYEDIVEPVLEQATA